MLAAVLLVAALPLKAQDKSIVKTGLNFGPLPAVAYDADKGFQYGVILQIFNYGDGHNYPNYDSKTYLEYSRFSKGSQLIQARYDNKELIPGVRWSSSARINIDKAYDFYGFNGYASNYDAERVAKGKAGDAFLYSPFYRYQRNEVLLKSDFMGHVNPNLQWAAGVFANYFKLSSIDRESINKGKSDAEAFPDAVTTLYDIYKATGVISEDEADGGLASGFRLGLVYDTRDKEGAPSSGIWASAHITAALPGISKIPYYRYALAWRQYIPLIDNNVLTFAYRIGYEGNIGSKAPFYALPYITNMGEKCDFEGMGGYSTVRGIMRTRAIGLDMALYNVELRWRFVNFALFNQNIALGLSAFSDGTMVTRGRDISALKAVPAIPSAVLNAEVDNDRPHITFGAGLRFIMNENFIVAAEYGSPLTHFTKNSPLYNQDGTGAFYINLGYLF